MRTETPRVTVVVAVYNGVSTIEACVTSLLGLDFPRDDYEVIVVDNGSTDGTAAVLTRLSDRVRVLHEPRRGAAAARNRGIQHARGSVIAFTDADCTVERGWLTALIEPLRDATVGVAGGSILGPTDANRIERFGERIHDQQRSIEVEQPPYVASGNWASRREVLQRIGLFDETLPRVQDVDLAWRIHQSGYRLVYVSQAVVRHRNERTVWGLMREGYVHGVHGIRVIDKHLCIDPSMQRAWTRTPARVVRDLRRLATERGRVDRLLWLVFDTGKSAGELVGLWRRRNATSAPVAATSPGRHTT